MKEIVIVNLAVAGLGVAVGSLMVSEKARKRNFNAILRGASDEELSEQAANRDQERNRLAGDWDTPLPERARGVNELNDQIASIEQVVKDRNHP